MKLTKPIRLAGAACLFFVILPLCIWLGRVDQSILDQNLISAIKRSDADSVAKLLSSGANPNARDVPTRATSLFYELKHLFAAQKPVVATPAVIVAVTQCIAGAREAILKSLLSRGADVNARDNEGGTPIILVLGTVSAIPLEQTRVLTMLLNSGADIDTLYDGYSTPLGLACMGSNPANVRLLLDRGANIEGGSGGFETPLKMACIFDRANNVKLLLQVFFRRGGTQSELNICLAAAHQHGCLDVEPLLTSAGAKDSAIR